MGIPRFREIVLATTLAVTGIAILGCGQKKIPFPSLAPHLSNPLELTDDINDALEAPMPGVPLSQSADLRQTFFQALHEVRDADVQFESRFDYVIERSLEGISFRRMNDGAPLSIEYQTFKVKGVEGAPWAGDTFVIELSSHNDPVERYALKYEVNLYGRRFYSTSLGAWFQRDERNFLKVRPGANGRGIYIFKYELRELGPGDGPQPGSHLELHNVHLHVVQQKLVVPIKERSSAVPPPAMESSRPRRIDVPKPVARPEKAAPPKIKAPAKPKVKARPRGTLPDDEEASFEDDGK